MIFPGSDQCFIQPASPVSHRCGLLLHKSHVPWYVFLSRFCVLGGAMSLQKWTNRSKCYSGAESYGNHALDGSASRGLCRTAFAMRRC